MEDKIQKQSIIGLLPKEITDILHLNHAYEGKQIFEWIKKGVTTFDAMTNISLQEKKNLNLKAILYTCVVNNKLTSKDGSTKLQIKTHDNLMIEAVLLQDKNSRLTACISSQAGCIMNCAFCKTGTLGFKRNLTVSEIVEEYLFLQEIAKGIATYKENRKHYIDNIVFMGMGEPLLNLEAVTRVINVFCSIEGFNISCKRITISTSGIVSKIYELADKNLGIKLAVSLTCAIEEIRRTLMPVASQNTLEELRNALIYYSQKTHERLTIEAVLLHEVNTSRSCAIAMINFCSGIDVYINLIAWNYVEGLSFLTPDKKECLSFMNILQQSSLNVVLRQSRGGKIAGACGQLGSV